MKKTKIVENIVERTFKLCFTNYILLPKLVYVCENKKSEKYLARSSAKSQIKSTKYTKFINSNT